MADTTLVDPLGRELVLHDRTWLRHIVKGHPEIVGDRPLVETAVCNPDEIRMSLSDADCRIYYGRGPREGVRMMVVGDIVLGIVKTAHLARKMTGGDVEWSK